MSSFLYLKAQNVSECALPRCVTEGNVSENVHSFAFKYLKGDALSQLAKINWMTRIPY
jgi:hypothetical protein